MILLSIAWGFGITVAAVAIVLSAGYLLTSVQVSKEQKGKGSVDFKNDHRL